MKKLLVQNCIRFEEITDFMEDINYADGAGHPAEVDQERLADKLLGSFQHIIHRARREAGELALEESDVEAVRCEEACDAGAAATQERPRRSDAGAATRSPRASGSRVDVLVAANTYPGWEQDLLNEHGIIFNAKTGNKKHFFHCQICKEHLPIWTDVPTGSGSRKITRAAAAPEEAMRARTAYGLPLAKGWYASSN